MRVTMALVLGLALSGLFACDDGNPLTDTLEVSGRVTDELTGAGLGGARITFTSDTGFRAETETGGGGHYEMAVDSDVPFGQVRAELDGYGAAERTVHFDTRSRVIDLALRPAE